MNYIVMIVIVVTLEKVVNTIIGEWINIFAISKTQTNLKLLVWNIWSVLITFNIFAFLCYIKKKLRFAESCYIFLNSLCVNNVFSVNHFSVMMFITTSSINWKLSFSVHSFLSNVLFLYIKCLYSIFRTCWLLNINLGFLSI